MKLGPLATSQNEEGSGCTAFRGNKDRSARPAVKRGRGYQMDEACRSLAEVHLSEPRDLASHSRGKGMRVQGLGTGELEGRYSGRRSA